MSNKQASEFVSPAKTKCCRSAPAAYKKYRLIKV